MRLDPDYGGGSQEAVAMVAKAAEFFTQSLAREAYTFTVQSKKKTLQKAYVDLAINAVDSLLFLYFIPVVIECRNQGSSLSIVACFYFCSIFRCIISLLVYPFGINILFRNILGLPGIYFRSSEIFFQS